MPLLSVRPGFEFCLTHITVQFPPLEDGEHNSGLVESLEGMKQLMEAKALLEPSRTMKWMGLLPSEDFWAPDFEKTQPFNRHPELSSCDRPDSAICEINDKDGHKARGGHLGHTRIIQKVTEEGQEQRGWAWSWRWRGLQLLFRDMGGCEF